MCYPAPIAIGAAVAPFVSLLTFDAKPYEVVQFFPPLSIVSISLFHIPFLPVHLIAASYFWLWLSKSSLPTPWLPLPFSLSSPWQGLGRFAAFAPLSFSLFFLMASVQCVFPIPFRPGKMKTLKAYFQLAGLLCFWYGLLSISVCPYVLRDSFHYPLGWLFILYIDAAIISIP